MEDPVADAILSRYFRRLEQALSGLPADRRAQIVEDLRAHVEESLAAEPDRSDATVMAILDRLGDPDEIAQEALADEAAAGVDGGLTQRVGARAQLPGAGLIRERWGVAAAALVALVAVVVVALSLMSGGSSALKTTANTRPDAGARLLVSRLTAVRGPDAISTCTSSGTDLAATTLESGATQVASGTIAGHSWSLWSKQGENGAEGLEDGGIVIDGQGYGLCARFPTPGRGFPNPAELEMVEPSGGGAGIVYGVVGYPGTAKVNVYRSTSGTFDRGALLATPQVRVVNAVAFFIGTLPQSACSYSSLELNSTSAQDSAEHNLGFGQCSAGHQVPITSSQGTWQLPPGHFPANFTGTGSGAGQPAPGVSKNGWLPSGDVSGGGGVDAFRCSPQTVTGSESTASLEASGTQVASGTVDGHSWSVWSKNGVQGGAGLEQGGVVIDGVAHGLCAGFPNPAEMELLEPSGGGDAIAYGVVGHPGAAKVDIYTSTAGTFDAGKLVGSTTSQVANGVGFFITPLSQSACELSALELNTVSADYATEHNLGFATNHCTNGQLVPINASQGIWELPPKDFPNHFGSGGGGQLLGGGRPGPPTLTNGWLPSGDVSGGGGVDALRCSPQTVAGSESTASLEAGATQVGSGTVDGHSWSVWSKNGVQGGPGLEQGGVVIDGVAHGLCAGFPNPAEMELLEPSAGGDAIAYGVVGYQGAAKVDIYTSTAGTFDAGRLVGSTTSQVANGVGFFITPLSESGCELSALELNTASADYATQHNLGFATNHCTDGQLVPINASQGVWELPPKDFPNHYGSGGGGQLLGGGAGPPSHTGPDFSHCSPPTNAGSSGQAATSVPDASQVASGTVGGQSWTLWSKNGETGSAALEDAGVILDGHSYGICPGAPNPAEFELVDPPNHGNGVVIGVTGYDGPATVKLSVGTPNSFQPGRLLYSGHTVAADGTGFFIAQLPKPACDYSWLVLNARAGNGHSQHLLGFGACTPGQLSPITGGMGAWDAPSPSAPISPATRENARSTSLSASGPPAPLQLTSTQRTELVYINRAQQSSLSRAACSQPSDLQGRVVGLGNPARQPDLSQGSPSAAILAAFSVLRRPATAQDKLPPRLIWNHVTNTWNRYPNGTIPPVHGVYIRYVRYARHRDGANYYLVPAENVNELGALQSLPGGCYQAQRIALQRELPHIPPQMRAGTLALQTEIFARQREGTNPYPGVCLVGINSTGNGDGGCSTGGSLSEIEQGRVIASGAPAGVPVVYGLAPDGVKSISFYYPGRQPLTALVINNVFVLHNPSGLPNWTKMVWRAADGHIIKTIMQ